MKWSCWLTQLVEVSRGSLLIEVKKLLVLSNGIICYGFISVMRFDPDKKESFSWCQDACLKGHQIWHDRFDNIWKICPLNAKTYPLEEKFSLFQDDFEDCLEEDRLWQKVIQLCIYCTSQTLLLILFQSIPIFITVIT